MTNKPDNKGEVSRRRSRRWKPDPRHISGIHNYCDRWCERCAFTARCAVAADEQAADDGDPASRDITNERFWKRLHEIFAETKEMIRDMAAQKGIDLDHIPPEEQAKIEAAEQKREEAVEQHPLARASRDYRLQVHQWLKTVRRVFLKKSEEWITAARLELPGHNPEKDALETRDAIDVITWYHTLIGVKLARAIGGRAEEVPELIENEPKDWDGSAKVALIGMERSLAAWSVMLRQFPEHELLAFLAALKRLQRQTVRGHQTTYRQHPLTCAHHFVPLHSCLLPCLHLNLDGYLIRRPDRVQCISLPLTESHKTNRHFGRLPLPSIAIWIFWLMPFMTQRCSAGPAWPAARAAAA